MNVKGFILEDDQGREFVMGCERPSARLGRTFLIRGWQRRRLIPLPYSEQEALMALDDLFSSLLKRCQDQTMTARLAEEVPEIRRLPLKTAHRCKA
ncbi:MAG: hypothetical protein HP495_01365 [Nitrospira sp.]|nr:hypothetical protein [Nitrospira sp.]